MDFWSVTQRLLGGFGVTCSLFALTLVLSLPLGLVIAFGSMSNFKPFAWFMRFKSFARFTEWRPFAGGKKIGEGGKLTNFRPFSWIPGFRPVSCICRLVVWVIRGTPLMLQLFVVFYAPGILFKVQPFVGMEGRFNASLVAFVINYACYFSEIYRGGIEGIPKGQYEAAQVLGMTTCETFFTVILMQVVKRILAPMSNEIITLVKDTSLARAIALAEIFHVTQNTYLTKGIIWPLFYIAVFFLIFVGILTLFFRWCEKKLDYYKV